MKRETNLITIAIVIFTLALVSCSAIDRGMEGNIYEKMTIFSMIVFTVFAIIFIPFVSNKGNNKDSARYRELIRNAEIHPLTGEELTSYPVYVWDSRKSFNKMIFGEDGSLSVSDIVTTNGIDPKAAPSGTWALTSEGILQLSLKVTSSTREIARVSQDGYHLATLLRLKSGYAKAWYLGEKGLALAQISCFGYSDSRPATERFTRSLLSGVSVYWGTYPCFIPTSSDELSINPELAFGMITFHEDGTLSKSINNPLDAVPDYRPSFTGTWKIDEHFGVLNLSVGLYATEITLLIYSAKHHSLLAGTTTGNEQWFLDPEHAARDLASYLAIGVYLDAGKSALFC